MENINNLDRVYGLDWTKMGGNTVICIVQETKCNNIIAVGQITQNGLERILKSQKQLNAWAGNIILGQTVVTKNIYCDCDRDTLLFRVEEWGQNKYRLMSRFQTGYIGELLCCPQCDHSHCQIIAVTQDANTGEVQMAGVMNQEAVQKTAQTDYVTFWSRSRKELWTKGETSGNFLKIDKALVDRRSCSVVLLTYPVGPVCHTGATTCFREFDGSMREYMREGFFVIGKQ